MENTIPLMWFKKKSYDDIELLYGSSFITGQKGNIDSLNEAKAYLNSLTESQWVEHFNEYMKLADIERKAKVCCSKCGQGIK